MTTRHALLLGSTGLIGGHLLDGLLASDAYHAVTLLGRRHPAVTHEKLDAVTCDLSALDSHADAFRVDDVFCCLGTTLKAVGSRAAFYQVDHDYCVAAAKLSAAASVKRFLMVSAVNANSSSRTSFYARAKGEAERDVLSAGLPSVTFMQPSLLEGERDEMRFGEEIGQAAMALIKPLVSWSKADWLSVGADVVADAMLGAALAPSLAPPLVRSLAKPLVPQRSIVTRIRYRKMMALSEKVRSEW